MPYIKSWRGICALTHRYPSSLVCANELFVQLIFWAIREVQLELQLTTNAFSWLPTRGGAVREIAYDIMAPLAYYQLGFPAPNACKVWLSSIYSALTEHYAIAKMDPQLVYEPECANWKRQRYITPDRTWLQGLRPDQLSERLSAFLTVRDRRGEFRLATREEFKAEFDRVLDFRPRVMPSDP